MSHLQRELFGIKIDALDMQQATSKLLEWTKGESRSCRYVVTPNVDHAVLLQENEELKAAYDDASMVLADGHPIVWASRLLGQPVPERVPGSDLVPELFSAVPDDEELTVFLLGAASGVAAKAAENMKERWRNVRTVGVYSPPMGFQDDPDECNYILGRIALVQPQILVVGLGAPKQECWVHAHKDQIRASVALCVGATIDFLAGEKSRAPVWMQKTGVEWLHRMCTEPKRLVKRYAKDAWIFPQLVAQQMWMGKQSR